MGAATSKEKLHIGFLSSGFLALLGGAYIDNIKNALLPVLAKDLNLSLDQAGLFLTLGNVGSFVFTFLIGYALKYRSERSITFFVCMAAVVVSSYTLFVTGSGSLFILATLMGGLGACLGTLTNILMMEGSTASFKGRLLTYTQMMGALAAISGPLVLTAIGSIDFHWAWLFVSSVPFFIVMAIFALKALPRRPKEPRGPTRERRTGTAPLSKWQLYIIGIFCVYVAAEGLSTSWMVMYIEKVFHYSTGESSRYLIAYLLIIAGTRFLAGTFVRPRFERYVLIATLLLGIVSSALGFWGYPIALSFIGLTGPFFPLFLGRICNIFPDSWKQITVYVSLAIQVFIAFCHYAMGALAEVWGLGAIFGVVPILFATTLFLLLFYLSREQNLQPHSRKPALIPTIQPAHASPVTAGSDRE